MNIAPLRDLVLVKADKPRSESESGLLISEDWKTLPLLGNVISVGPEVNFVKPGDRVVFERYASVVLENDERLCKQAHIFGVVK